MKHIKDDNIELCFTRQSIGDGWQHIFISNVILECCIVSLRSREISYIAPLFVYQDNQNGNDIFEHTRKMPNFSEKFKGFLQTLDFKPNPNKIMAYIYAVLHSTTYRKKYIEFLKTDFPAIPFTKDKAIFEKYAKLGQKLIDLHLLKNLPKDTKIKVSNVPQKEFTIDNIDYEDNVLVLYTKSKQRISFVGVTPEIYNFEIGSYKPIEKWLKYRKKDNVSLCLQDLEHLKNMIIAIKNTINIMQDIEDLKEAFSDDV